MACGSMPAHRSTFGQVTVILSLKKNASDVPCRLYVKCSASHGVPLMLAVQNGVQAMGLIIVLSLLLQ